MKKSTLFSVLIIILLFGGGLYFIKDRLFSKTAERIAYHTEAVERGTIEVKVNGVGEISAAQLVTVGAQVSGKIERIHVTLGAYVKKDDVIAEIDATTQSSELETRKSRLSTYKAQLVNHNIAANIAQAQYNRKKLLFSQQSTSKLDLENAEKAYSQAKAELKATKSLIAQEEVAIAKAEADLGYTRILAPIEGTIVSLPVEVGQTVNANQTTPTIALLADLSRMEIKVQISEGDITKVSQNMPVSFYILSEPDTVFHAKLDSIDPAHTALTDEYDSRKSSSSSDNAVFYYGRLLVPNPDNKLRIGMTTHCTIAIAREDNVLRVPTVAIKERKGQTYVRILKDGIPEEREVVTGLFNSLYTEIKSGLMEGEKVITAQMSQAEIDEQIRKRRR